MYTHTHTEYRVLKDITVYFGMQTRPPQSSSGFAFTHAQKKNITEEEEMLNIISDSSDLSVSRLKHTVEPLAHAKPPAAARTRRRE